MPKTQNLMWFWIIQQIPWHFRLSREDIFLNSGADGFTFVQYKVVITMHAIAFARGFIIWVSALTNIFNSYATTVDKCTMQIVLWWCVARSSFESFCSDSALVEKCIFACLCNSSHWWFDVFWKSPILYIKKPKTTNTKNNYKKDPNTNKLWSFIIIASLYMEVQ